LQEARAIIKSGKGFANAEKMMVALLKDSANLNNIRIYDMWLQSVEKQYDQVNEQMYKKQVVDTASLFGLARRIFMIAERLDSIDMRPDKKGRVHLTYREDNAQRLNTYRPNLFFGGTYFLRKNNLQQAYDLFEHYIDCAHQPLFTDLRYEETDARLPEAAYWATYCGYRMENPVLTLRHAKLARRDSLKLESTLQYVSQAWLRLKDDSSYVATLQEGFRHFPKSGYFFPRLMDSYTSKGNYGKALGLADEALAVDSLHPLFLLAKSTMLLNLGNYAQCITYSDRLISVDPEMADAYYNAGTAYLNITLNMDARKYRKQIRKMYQQAMPYMETYRKLAPDERQKWGPALYRIYFNLNMGKQFDEIDKILKK
jgi:tetratricopeptide (TPR) repeat protein